MDCETCTEMLVDLACGELDEVRAAAVRKHCAGCAECGPSLARLERGRSFSRALVREEPPSVSDALRDAITRAAAEYAKNPAAPAKSAAAIPAENASLSDDERADPSGRASSPSSPSSVVRLVPRWLERVGAVAMRRQVAMAAVFLVTVGVGLAYYQTHPRVSQLADARRPDVVPAQEVAAGPSTVSGTATPNAPVTAHRALQTPSPLVAVRPPTVRSDDSRGASAPSNAGNGRTAPMPAPVVAMASRQTELQQNFVARPAADDDAPLADPAPPSEARGRPNEQRAEESATVTRLRAALASATDPTERSRLANELAVELQRLGRNREADQVVANNANAPTPPNAGAAIAAAPPVAAAHENRAQAGRAGNANSAGTVAASVDREPANSAVNTMPVIPRPARAPTRMARPRAAQPGANMMDDMMNAYH